MKKIATILFILFLSNLCHSQKTVKEWAEMDDKKFTKKMQFYHANYHFKKLIKPGDHVPKLEKIGFLGFSIFQPTYSDKNPYSIITPYLTSEGKTFFTDLLFNPAFRKINSSLESADINLMPPLEFANTPEKRARYEQAEFEASKLMKVMVSISNRIRGGRVKDVKGTADGYKYLMFAGGDPKIYRAVGKFATEMEVDAFLVIETTLGYDGKSLILSKIEASLIGPNPIPERASDKKLYAPVGPLKGYMEGINYGSLGGTSPKGGILLATLKKGNVKDSNFEGVGEVYSRIVNQLLQNINEEFDKIRAKS